MSHMTLQERKKFMKKRPLAYGGELRSFRAQRAKSRPLSNRQSMHLVLRASRAKGPLSFKQPRHAQKIQKIVQHFGAKYRVKILSLANVGNHLHFHVQLHDFHGYKPFIRAITSAIAMAVSGSSRWNKVKEKFWDYRPFTNLVTSKASYLRLVDYIEINKLEGLGYGRFNASFLLAREHDRRNGWPSG
jgi:REP element-mobilizing transposase RayT